MGREQAEKVPLSFAAVRYLEAFDEWLKRPSEISEARRQARLFALRRNGALSREREVRAA